MAITDTDIAPATRVTSTPPQAADLRFHGGILGLSEREAAKRLATDGPNEFASSQPRSIWVAAADISCDSRGSAASHRSITTAPINERVTDWTGYASRDRVLYRSCDLDVHLVDGTYELFRHYYALPSARDADGREVAAVRGVLASVLGMIRDGATHIGVATDHVIESFRNGLWPGYKTGEGIEPDLLAQFPVLEEALSVMGVVVWPMVEFEADDALAAAAVAAAADPHVERVVICTPDKDLAQCVRGTRIVQLNRRTHVTLDEAGVVQKFGVSPESIPDYLALVGDAADGYPGLPGWGAKSSAAVLAKFVHLESIPKDSREWRVNAANASALAGTLCREWDRAMLFRTLATLRADITLFDDVEHLRWNGPTPEFTSLAARLDTATSKTGRVAPRPLSVPIVQSALIANAHKR